ncbi:MAG TPA: hypothetical protein VGY52_10840 [Roseiarcus sp.]|jgi:hypothetical protein|nr:hypothetical protein [Roseiarcus sp.]
MTLRDRAALQYIFEMTINEADQVVVDLVKVRGDTSLLSPVQAKMQVAAECLSDVLFGLGDCQCDSCVNLRSAAVKGLEAVTAWEHAK